MDKELDYRKIICIMIDEGFITCDQAKHAVKLYKNDLQKQVKSGPTWDVARRLMSFMNDLIIQNGKKPFRTNESALAVFEKLHRIDGYSEEEIMSMIMWCQSHDFWSTVVLSPEKLRRNYDQMLLQQERDSKRKVEPVAVYKANDVDWEREIERRRSEAKPMPKGIKEMLRGAKAV